MPEQPPRRAAYARRKHKTQKLFRKVKPGKVTATRPVAGSHRHPPLPLPPLRSPKPSRRRRAKSFPRRQRRQAGQIHPHPPEPNPHPVCLVFPQPRTTLTGPGLRRGRRSRRAVRADRRLSGRRRPLPGASRSAAAPLGEVQESPSGAGFPFSLGVLFCLFLSSFRPPPPALGAEPSSGRLQFAV